MGTAQDLARLLAAYSGLVVGPGEVPQLLGRLAEQIALLLHATGAGVLLLDEAGSPRLVIATDGRTERVEQRQLDVVQGPGHDALRDGRCVTSPDLRQEQRWPRFVPVAVEHGCLSAACVPLQVGDSPIGALDLYRDVPSSWVTDELALAEGLAAIVAGCVVHARAHAEDQRLVRQLERALESRVSIEQAKGVLAERHHITTAAAFERLRGHARHHNLHLAEVARGVVEGHVRL